MKFASQLVGRWLRIGLTLGVLVVASTLVARGQEQTKPSAKPPAKASPQFHDDPLASLLLQAANAIEKNDFAAALEPLQKYIAERGEDSFAHFQLGYAYSGLKRWEDAKVEFTRALALDPKMAPAYLNLGLVLMESDPTAAADSFRRAAELQPSESRPRYLTGTALERAGKHNEAVEQYRAALEISPKDYDYNLAIGRELLHMDKASDAEGHFRDAAAVRADSAPAQLGLANALLAQKKFDAAAEALAEYLKLNSGDRAARLDRASALVTTGRYDDALAELDRIEATTAPTEETLKMRGNIYSRQQKWSEANDALTRALAPSPKDADMLLWLGHVKIELREYSAAIKLLAQAYSTDRNSPDALRELVNAFFLNGDYPETLGAMDRLAKLEEPQPSSWFVRAICYDKLSRKAEAVAAYQKFLDLNHGQNDTQDFQARHRIVTLQNELEHEPKRKKK
jgi:Flp pilus assembly protein TadD